MVSHRGFDLYILDAEWCGAFFHVSVGHLYVFFREMSVHVFCPYLDQIFLFVFVFFERGRLGEVQREGGRISQAGSMPSLVPDAGLGIMMLRSWLDLKLRVRCLTNPGAPRSFLFWWSPSSLFLFFFPLPQETYLEKCCYGQCLGGYSMYSLLGF